MPSTCPDFIPVRADAILVAVLRGSCGAAIVAAMARESRVSCRTPVDRGLPSSSTRSSSSSPSVQWGALAIALLAFTAYLSLRARASFNILRAAYPSETIRFRDIWAAYFAGYGFNSVIPARGGDVIRLFLTKTSVPRSSYPAVGASFFVENIFDLTMAVFILSFAFTQGVFPKPPDFADLGAFDLSYFAQHPQLRAVHDHRAGGRWPWRRSRSCRRACRAFWERVKQGLTILLRPRAATSARCGSSSSPAGCSASRRSGSCSRRSTSAGRSRTCCSSSASTRWRRRCRSHPAARGCSRRCSSRCSAPTRDAAYSVGQQIAIAAWTFGLGFLAIAIVFRIRSFKEIIRRGREDRAADKKMRADASAGRDAGARSPAG